MPPSYSSHSYLIFSSYSTWQPESDSLLRSQSQLLVGKSHMRRHLSRALTFPRYISSFALLALTATAAGPLKLSSPPDHAFSQAFYYAIISAVLYFLVASLMVVTVYGAYAGHYDNEFKLTLSQRTLMLQTISFLVYLLCGAAVYSHVEGWNFLDAVYFADFTLLTVGVGDFSPSTHIGRGLLFPYGIGGIIILGLVIGSIRSLVLERGKAKMEARMVEKERQRVLKRIEKKHSNILLPIGKEGASISRSSSTTLGKMEGRSERERRRQEFEVMRKIQHKAISRRQWSSLVISGTTWLVLWFAGAAIFQASEDIQDWSYFEALYFSYTSLLTIGYGDMFPVSESGKPFFVLWSLLAVPSLTILISNMGDTIVKGIRDLTLWIGELTILPGEHGIRNSMKRSAHQLTKGKIFSEEIKEQPAGLLGEAQKQNTDGGDERNDPESAAQQAAGEQAHADVSRANRAGRDHDRQAAPESKRHYHVMLIEEIGNVTKHLSSSPPRKYTFDEWAWFLKLIGEDEASARTHRKAAQHQPPDGEGPPMQSTTGEKYESADGDGNTTTRSFEWSWIGDRSPLMGNKEEAEWVLERLIITLKRELARTRREELQVQGKEGEAVGGKDQRPSREQNDTKQGRISTSLSSRHSQSEADRASS